MFEKVKVGEFMTRPVVTVFPGTPIGEAHRIMKYKAIRRLPVTERGKLIGIITIGDVREAEPSDATSLSIWEINTLWARLTVKDVMSKDVITIGEEDSIINAAKLMMEHKIGGIPVVGAHDTPVGIVTESDIFRMLIQHHTEPEPIQTTI